MGNRPVDRVRLGISKRFIMVRSGSTPEPVESALSAWSHGSTKRWETVDLARNPTYVILDLGCTRAMGSRKAIHKLVDAASHKGVCCEFLPPGALFNFANSQTTRCKEKEVQGMVPVRHRVHVLALLKKETLHSLYHWSKCGIRTSRWSWPQRQHV